MAQISGGAGMIEPKLIFHHEAMNTTFTVSFPERASHFPLPSIAMECFELLDELEHQLSRYYEGSEIQQINAMQSGESLVITPSCYECLVQANRVFQDSRGAFDITLGKLIEHYKKRTTGSAPVLEGNWVLDAQRSRITCVQAGREMDLGGIGKGYALDQMAKVLLGWEIEEALLAAGASTQLVLGQREVKFELIGDLQREKLLLKNQALSASGVDIQAVHIISPQAQNSETLYKRAWCIAESATLADAWSTAAMLMSGQELAQALLECDYLSFFATEAWSGVIQKWDKAKAASGQS